MDLIRSMHPLARAWLLDGPLSSYIEAFQALLERGRYAEGSSAASVQTTAKLPLLDLRPHASSWPVLHSLRFDQTQALAAEAHAAGFLGVVYKSAQQYDNDCFALWGQALTALRRMFVDSLVEPGSGNLHIALATALKGSRLPLLP